MWIPSFTRPLVIRTGPRKTLAFDEFESAREQSVNRTAAALRSAAQFCGSFAVMAGMVLAIAYEPTTLFLLAALYAGAVLWKHTQGAREKIGWAAVAVVLLAGCSLMRQGQGWTSPLSVPIACQWNERTGPLLSLFRSSVGVAVLLFLSIASIWLSARDRRASRPLAVLALVIFCLQWMS